MSVGLPSLFLSFFPSVTSARILRSTLVILTTGCITITYLTVLVAFRLSREIIKQPLVLRAKIAVHYSCILPSPVIPWLQLLKGVQRLLLHNHNRLPEKRSNVAIAIKMWSLAYLSIYSKHRYGPKTCVDQKNHSP